MTESGRTADDLPYQLWSANFAMSRHERTLNLTALYRGVTPVHLIANDGVAALPAKRFNLLRDKGY